MNRRFVDAWALTAAAAVLMAITMGSRSAFGLLVSPMNTATGLGIATISFAGAVSQLGWGLAQPFAGAAAERYGTSRVIAAGGVLAALGTALLTVTDTAAGLVGAFALLACAGAAMGGGALLLAEVNRDVAPARRGLAAGIVGAGASVGQLVLAPAVQTTIDTAGWIAAMWGLAAIALFALPLARAFERAPAGANTGDAPPVAASAAPTGTVRDALASPGFWLVTGGFFVCGFHVSFLLAHMPGQIALCGLPASVSGVWLAIIGACNVAGSLAAGAAVERMSAKRLLIALYALRALGVAAFLALPRTEANVLAFGVWMGLTYMATLAPTSTLIARRFGTARFATLFGIVMLVHQVGAFLGVWLGGVALATTGSLDWIWYADIALAIAAAAVHVPLRERPAVPAPQTGAQDATPATAAVPPARLAPATFAMPDGRVIAIRAIDEGDRERLAEFVRELSPQSRRRRFFSAIRELSGAMLDRLTHPDPARERVLVAIAGAAASRRIVGLAQFAPTDNGEDCEFALVVADDAQGQGLGLRMMDALVDAARVAGYREVVGDVLRDNRAMLGLARRAGFQARADSRDPLLTRVARSLGDRARAAGAPRIANAGARATVPV